MVIMMYNFDKSLSRFSRLLKIETVAGNDGEFVKFREVLKELYPNIAKNCKLERIGDSGLMYKWKGKNSSKAIVLMSHYDVVPASPEQWDKPPFSGEISGGAIWGRGAIDTKCTLCAVMESVEALLGVQGFIPDFDVYMCFGGDEETAGNDAVAIATVLRRRGVKPFLIIDEGGAVVQLPQKLQKKGGGRVALIGIAEKGYMDVEFIAKGRGGHTSLPVIHSPLVTISEVIRRLKNPFKPTISTPVRIMGAAIANQFGFKIKVALRSTLLRRIFMPKLIRVVPEVGALTQTTGAITLISGGSAANVIPEEVRAVGNFRVISGTTVDETLGIIKKALRGLDVEVNLIESLEPSKTSRVDGDGWDALNSAIVSTWGVEEDGKGIAVVPYLMIARSDSRFYSDISDSIYRFSPMVMTKIERNSIHGVNERISVENFRKMIEFYILIVRNK
ncbi:MAG: M20/M25/M40 family metallo-hydrolase [Oscillospiraceae bacterium]|nr:M20/M25/M40 family metallo-hydrolase [Oscillospiraceae bacterium]